MVHDVSRCMMLKSMCSLPHAAQEYHVKVRRPDGSWGWQGGRDLANSAEYTWSFCRALLKCWEQRKQTDDSVLDGQRQKRAKSKAVSDKKKTCASAREKQNRQVRANALRRSPRIAAKHQG